MPLFFISAVSGTGKSTLMHELRKRDQDAHDTDVECVRLSRITGEVVDYERAKVEGYDWIYPKEALNELKMQSANHDVFLLGSIDNLSEVIAAADEFIWMTIPLDILNERLDKRAKEYGKSFSERRRILSGYNEMTVALGPEVFKLDATKSVEAIADDLLDHVKEF